MIIPIKSKLVFTTALVVSFTLSSCKKTVSEASELTEETLLTTEISSPKIPLSKEFKDYWYAGDAEITSYQLEQARYGEIREGAAVLVFVTEDFLADTQVKADHYDEKNISVLKLNATKNFVTGIYPYSIMQSTFFPVSNNQHALKISASIQEWCGHVYTQLNNRGTFEMSSHSYFQGEADEDFNLEKTWTENELWTKLRIDPNSLPKGSVKIIPALEYLKLSHETIKAYTANASLDNGLYTISYPDLNRSLKINFNTQFPFDILGWEETTLSGHGTASKLLTTTARKLKTIKSDYWTRTNNSDHSLRETLKLD